MRLASLRRLLEEWRLQGFVTGTSWALGLRALGLASGYGFMLLVSRVLGAAAWGAFSLALTVIMLCSIIGRLGLDLASLRLIAAARPEDRDAGVVRDIYSKALCTVAAVSVSISVMIYVFAGAIATLIFRDAQLAQELRISSLGILPVALVYLNEQSLRALKRVREYVFLDLVACNLLAAVLCLPIILYTRNPVAAIVAYVGGAYIAALISFIWLVKQARFAVPQTITRRVPYRVMLTISLPLMSASSIQFGRSAIDIIMLGLLMNVPAVGIYNVALPFSRLVSLPLLAVDSFVSPRFAELYALGDTVRLRQLFTRSTQLIALLATPILLVILVGSRVLLGFSGPAFEEGASVLILLSLGQYVNAITGSTGYLLLMTGEQVFFQNITIATTIMGIFLNYAFIRWWGLSGAGLSGFLTLIFLNLGCVVYIRKKLHLSAPEVPGMRGGG